MVEFDGHTDLNYGSVPHDLCSWTSYWTSLSCGFLFHKMNKLYFLYKAVILGQEQAHKNVISLSSSAKL